MKRDLELFGQIVGFIAFTLIIFYAPALIQFFGNM